MSKVNDDLDNEFGIFNDEEEPKVEIIKKESTKPIIVSDQKRDSEKYYQYARAQLYDIVEKMQ